MSDNVVLEITATVALSNFELRDLEIMELFGIHRKEGNRNVKPVVKSPSSNIVSKRPITYPSI